MKKALTVMACLFICMCLTCCKNDDAIDAQSEKITRQDGQATEYVDQAPSNNEIDIQHENETEQSSREVNSNTSSTSNGDIELPKIQF